MKSCNKDCTNNYTIDHQTLNILFSVVFSHKKSEKETLMKPWPCVMSDVVSTRIWPCVMSINLMPHSSCFFLNVKICAYVAPCHSSLGGRTFFII